jgi:hypothetical protein
VVTEEVVDVVVVEDEKKEEAVVVVIVVVLTGLGMGFIVMTARLPTTATIISDAAMISIRTIRPSLPPNKVGWL